MSDIAEDPKVDDERDASERDDLKVVTFEADSALLRELGERLVGQPHIALAELIKNAYDADATVCTVEIEEDAIVVSDDGHGMTENEFLRHWMTIGTRNKQVRSKSRRFERNVTGSKGVGRLSAQFLAHKLQLYTRSEDGDAERLEATVDWDEAIDAGRLTEAKAYYRVGVPARPLPDRSKHGTRVTMRGLKQSWDEEAVKRLGEQLWLIQSPLPEFGRLRTEGEDPSAFRVRLTAFDDELDDAFERQMSAALENYNAVIEGRIERSDDDRTISHITVKFKDGESHSETFEIAPYVKAASWTIRVFNLQGRQGPGVKVGDAREYLRRFGGVQVYDAGFRLPYYGVEQDWLGIELDHSHRLNRSKLLPERLQVRRALNDLPTQGRIFGVVRIDTGLEARKADGSKRESGEYLKIQVTRDRLVANAAYGALRDAVRASVDFYATRQRIREENRIDFVRPSEPSSGKLERVRSLADGVAASYPNDDDAQALRSEIADLERTMDQEREADDGARTLLGPLAAAGMAALALEHESRKEMRAARNLLRKLESLARSSDDSNFTSAIEGLRQWLSRLENTRRVFAPLLDQEDREQIEALRLETVVRMVIDNVASLLPGVRIDVDVPRDLLLPPATFAEWNSLFQNVFVNASNAMLDEDTRTISCEGGRTGRQAWVRISDRGTGIDWNRSTEYFEPFRRETSISDERKGLGLGGMGLGLTIVRMIADQRRCKVEFLEPQEPWATTFRMIWSSKV